MTHESKVSRPSKADVLALLEKQINNPNVEVLRIDMECPEREVDSNEGYRQFVLGDELYINLTLLRTH